MRARFYSGPINSPEPVKGGGLYPTRLAAHSENFALAAIGKRIHGLRFDISAYPPPDSCDDSGIAVVTYALPVSSELIDLEIEAADDIQVLPPSP